MARGSSRLPQWAACLAAILALNVLAYAPALRGPFVFDDYLNILAHPAVQAAANGDTPLINLAKPGLGSRRPLPYLTFALNLREFGPDPLYFHLANLALHLANAVLVFLLGLALAQRVRLTDAGPRWLPALAGALFWSLHPLQTQAVDYMVQRMTLMAALGYLLAVYGWLRGRLAERGSAQAAWYAAAAVAGVLGFFCKEIVATLPLALLLFDYVWFADPDPKRGRLKTAKAALAVLLGYAGLAAVFGPQVVREIGRYSGRFTGLAGRVLTQARVTVDYLSLLFFPDPARQNLDPSWTPSSGLFTPWTTAPSLLLILAAVGIGVWLLRQKKPAGAMALFFFLALLPEAGLFPLDPAFEHRLYLPTAGILAFAGAAAVWPGRRLGLRRALAAGAVGCLLVLSHGRSALWSDELALWRDTAKKSPANVRSWLNLSKHLMDVGDYAMAVTAGRRATVLADCAADGFSNLGGAYLGLQKPAEARRAFETALACEPGFETARAGIVLANSLAADPSAPSPLTPAAPSLDPTGAERLYRRGWSRLRDGRRAEGLRDLTEALRREPDHLAAQKLLRQALAEGPAAR